jgi:hypothetical protein
MLRPFAGEVIQQPAALDGSRHHAEDREILVIAREAAGQQYPCLADSAADPTVGRLPVLRRRGLMTRCGRIRAHALGRRSTALAVAILGVPSLVSALTVNTLAVDDDGACAPTPGGDCTLVEAINAANAAAGADTIDFALPGGAPFIIKPTAALPAITGPLTIDGATQAGFAGTPIVVLDGSIAGVASGLFFGAGSAGSTLRGLAVVRFAGAGGGNGVLLGSGGNTVAGNYIGIDADGATDAGNEVHGVLISSNGNTIGGTAAADRNVISGNGNSGVLIIPLTVLGATEADDNKVIGNYIGTNAAGTAAVANSIRGVGIFNGQDNLIGDPMNPASGNLISGNTNAGVFVLPINIPATAPTRPADRNVVAFNRVGTNAAGTAAIPNGSGPTGTGINLQGNDNSALDNLASGNVGAGIFLGRDSAVGPPASGNVARRNRVGTNAAGTAALPNTGIGILLLGATSSQVGGTLAQGNLVSGNGGNGITLGAFTSNLSSLNTISGNLIGTEATGAMPLPNGTSGQAALSLAGGSDNNTLSGNVVAAAATDGHGIAITGGSDNNVVSDNFVGTNAAGANLGNSVTGIFLNGVNDTLITGNRIAFNLHGGIRVMDTEAAATNNTISANRLHDNMFLGIDLAADGITANDAGDGDGGPNLRQNFPVITSAEATAGGMLDVTGTLDSPAGAFAIELFASATCDPSLFGEGATYLGLIDIQDAAVVPFGLPDFAGSVPYSPASGARITATATDENGNTSEFSACATAVIGYLDIDLDGQVTALTDGLLFLRHAFAFSGSVLVTGAVGPQCTRCLANDIAAYLASIQLIIDIDGDGSTLPLTDALLVLRYLFGFRGTVLTNNAVSMTCTRCTAAQIENYIASLLAPQ